MDKVYNIKPLVLSSYIGEKSLMTYSQGFGHKILRPFVMWAIIGEDYSLIVDTAMEAKDVENYHPTFKNFIVKNYMSFEEALRQVEMTPDSVKLIVQTHLHWDHCGNTKKCKNAKVIVQKDEWHFANNALKPFNDLYKKSLIEELNIETVEGDHKLAPGIELLKVPGHTPGCQAVSVATEKGKAIISGFCVINENFFPKGDPKERPPLAGSPVLLPGIFVDAKEAYNSLIRIKEEADIILPLHEPKIATMKII